MWRTLSLPRKQREAAPPAHHQNGAVFRFSPSPMTSRGYTAVLCTTPGSTSSSSHRTPPQKPTHQPPPGLLRWGGNVEDPFGNHLGSPAGASARTALGLAAVPVGPPPPRRRALLRTAARAPRPAVSCHAVSC